MIAHIGGFVEMDAPEIHARRLNAQEVLTPQRSGKFIFPVADGTKTSFGPGHFPTQFQDYSTRDDGDAQSDFWTITGVFIYRHHVCTPSQTVRVERRIISYSVCAHRRCQKNLYVTERNLGKTDWSLLERGWSKRIVRCMDRIHKDLYYWRKVTGRMYMVWEAYKETKNFSS